MRITYCATCFAVTANGIYLLASLCDGPVKTISGHTPYWIKGYRPGAKGRMMGPHGNWDWADDTCQAVWALLTSGPRLVGFIHDVEASLANKKLTQVYIHQRSTCPYMKSCILFDLTTHSELCAKCCAGGDERSPIPKKNFP